MREVLIRLITLGLNVVIAMGSIYKRLLIESIFSVVLVCMGIRDLCCFTFSTINIQDTTITQSQSTVTEPLQPSIPQTQKTRELTSMVQYQRTEQVNARLSEEQQLRESTTIAEPQPLKPLDSCALQLITWESSL